jgi:hypothetical protein
MIAIRTGGEDSGELRGVGGMSTGLSTRQWRKGRLQDLVFFQRGFDITQVQQSPGPYPVIPSSGVTSFHDEFKVNGPGIVIGRKGALGSIHFSENDYWPHDTTFRSKELRDNNARFVYYYYLHTINFKRFDVGNSNPTLNRNHIHSRPPRPDSPAKRGRPYRRHPPVLRSSHQANCRLRISI